MLQRLDARAAVLLCAGPCPANGAAGAQTPRRRRRGPVLRAARGGAEPAVAAGRGAQGESLPMRATVVQMVERLAAAGVGARPTVFICHRCGRRLRRRGARLLQGTWGGASWARQVADCARGMRMPMTCAQAVWRLALSRTLPRAFILSKAEHSEE